MLVLRRSPDLVPSAAVCLASRLPLTFSTNGGPAVLTEHGAIDSASAAARYVSRISRGLRGSSGVEEAQVCLLCGVTLLAY
jgi:hypothetical protein